MAIAIAVGLLIAAIPLHGLSRVAHAVVAIIGFTTTVWMLRVMPNGVASILMMALMILAGVRTDLVLSGFATPQFWILLSVLFYGFAMERSGLARRLSYYILSLFPPTYGGIVTAFFVIGTTLALGIPSMTVRTAIIVPTAWALTQSLGLGARSRGSALIVLTSIEMAVIPGCAFLYGSLFGPVVESLFRVKAFQLSWLGYAAVMTAPTMFLCILILVLNCVVLRPEAPLQVERPFARAQLRGLGPIAPAELFTAFVVTASVVYWATDRWHHLPSFLAGMIGVALFALAGIVRDKELSVGVSWPLLLFLGGIFSLANVIQDQKITDWIGQALAPSVAALTSNHLVALLVMTLAMFAVRFVDPTGFIALAVVFLPLADTMQQHGIPPLVFVAPLVLACVPFWASYQNIWVAMGDAMTGDQAFGPAHRIRLANAYAIAVLLTVAAGFGFWKITGAF